MPIQIVQPRQVAQEKEESTIDKILKGLQIAQTGFGIYSEIEKVKTLGAQTRQAEAETEKTKLETEFYPASKGFSEVQEGPPSLLPPQRQSPSLLTPQERESMVIPGAEQPKLIPSAAQSEQQTYEIGGKKYIKKDSEKDLATNLKLTDDYYKNQTTTETETMGNALERFHSAEPTAVGDMTRMYSFIKVLDPRSGIKEGEVANAQNAAGTSPIIRDLYNSVLGGLELKPDQRAKFASQMNKMMAAQLRSQERIDETFRKDLENKGLDTKKFRFLPVQGWSELIGTTTQSAPKEAAKEPQRPERIPIEDWNRMTPETRRKVTAD